MLDVDFGLLSDWNAEATRGFGLARVFLGMVDVPARSAFLVDREGLVGGAWSYGDSELPDLDQLVGAAHALTGNG